MASIFDTDLPRTEANFAPLTPLAFIQRTAEVYPDRLAIVHGDLRQSWAETYARCRRLASSLQRHGIGKNDTVAAMLPNTPPMVEAHFGVPMAGAVLNALNTRLDPEAVAFMLDHGEAKAVIADPEFTGVLAKALALRSSSILALISSSAWSQLIFWYLPPTSFIGLLRRNSPWPFSRTAAPLAQCAPRLIGESKTGS